jgi:hypothetical protein
MPVLSARVPDVYLVVTYPIEDAIGKTAEKERPRTEVGGGPYLGKLG